MPRRRHERTEPIMWGWVPTDHPYSVRYVQAAPVDEILGRIVRNPGYGGPRTSHPHGYPYQEIPEVGFKPGFFAALRADVAKNGFRNPILLHSLGEGLYLQFGASRYRVARHLDLSSIPAIVVDWIDRYCAEPRVTPDNWTLFFTDLPKYFEFTPEGIDHNYALERKLRAKYDPAGFDWCGEDAEFISKDFPWMTDR